MHDNPNRLRLSEQRLAPVQVEVTSQELDAVRDRLADVSHEFPPTEVNEFTQEFVTADVTYVTEDGEPLVDVLRNERSIDITDDDVGSDRE